MLDLTMNYSSFQISLLSVSALVCVASAELFDFGIGKIPPYGIPLIEPEKEEIEKGLEIAKELSLDKAWPWLEKEFASDKGISAELDLEKELEMEKFFGSGIAKGYSWEKSTWLPWSMWEKYFGVGKKKVTFEVALAIELYKKYGWYGLWVARELERRFAIAKELGLIGQEIAFQEAISLGLFKGIGLDKIFEAALKTAGVEKAAAATEATKESLEKVFGNIWKKF